MSDDFNNIQNVGGSQRSSSSEEAARGIRTMIRDNAWKAGHRLPSQRALSKELGLSRPTVREALLSMELQGVVSILPGKGVFLAGEGASAKGGAGRIARSDQSALAGKESQMYQFRYAIEPAVAGLAAVNATSAQVDDLAVLVHSMRQAMASEDLASFARLDFAFHSQLIDAANNPFFTEAIRPFLDLFFESQKLPYAHLETLTLTVEEHQTLVSHLRSRDAAAARGAMENHVVGAAGRAGISIQRW